jgi:Zn-dependent protease
LNDTLDALAFYLVFVAAVTCHEAAHAWAAKIGGDLTAYRGGQVSLDPIPHMKREPIGMVVLPLITVSTLGWPLGYASTPYDPVWAGRYPRRAAWMALAGPAANFGLVLVAALLIHTGIGFGLFEAPDSLSLTSIVAAADTGEKSDLAGGFALIRGFAQGLSLFYSMNVLLLVLNLIPLPPFDGSGALPLILSTQWNRAYQRLIRQPMIGWVGIIVVWNLLGKIFYPILFFSISLLYPGLSYS